MMNKFSISIRQLADKFQISNKLKMLGLSIGNSRQRRAGFTLVELLAVIAITGVVGTMMFGVLFTTLRGADKSESVGKLQENGNFALSQMSRMVRFAQELQYPDTCYQSTSPAPVITSSITILNADNYSTTFACDIAAGTIASNSATLLDPATVSMTACSFSCTQATPYDAPSLTISFTLNKKDSNAFVENNSPVQFQTTVILRNVR